MDFINWSLNATDTIFSVRRSGLGEPDCPAGTFTAGYAMDAWDKWQVVCLAPLSVEDVEDLYLFGTMIAGFLLIGLGIGLVYRVTRKMKAAVSTLTKDMERIMEHMALQKGNGSFRFHKESSRANWNAAARPKAKATAGITAPLADQDSETVLLSISPPYPSLANESLTSA